jgi:hypothetical protein
MGMNLYGEFVEMPGDYARRLIAVLNAQPSYRILGDDTANGIKQKYQEKIGNNWVDVELKEVAEPGLYCFFHEGTCLYVGNTTDCVSQRTYRFIKELADKSRDDEGHPGAEKARQFDMKAEDIHYKFVPASLAPKPLSEFSIVDDIDAYVAFLLKSRFNVKQKAC